MRRRIERHCLREASTGIADETTRCVDKATLIAIAWLLAPAVTAVHAQATAEEMAREAAQEAAQEVAREVEERVSPTLAAIFGALALPEIVAEARDEGVADTTLVDLIDRFRGEALPAADASDLLDQEVEVLRAGGPVDNFGAFVQSQLASGLRGRELAAAIRAEHRRQGIGIPAQRPERAMNRRGGRGQGPERGPGARGGPEGRDGPDRRGGPEGGSAPDARGNRPDTVGAERSGNGRPASRPGGVR